MREPREIRDRRELVVSTAAAGMPSSAEMAAAAGMASAGEAWGVLACRRMWGVADMALAIASLIGLELVKRGGAA